MGGISSQKTEECNEMCTRREVELRVGEVGRGGVCGRKEKGRAREDDVDAWLLDMLGLPDMVGMSMVDTVGEPSENEQDAVQSNGTQIMVSDASDVGTVAAAPEVSTTLLVREINAPCYLAAVMSRVPLTEMPYCEINCNASGALE